MADRTAISWCDATWNPYRGCSRVSLGCVNCYAERMCARGLPGLKSPTTGEDFAVKMASGPRWTGRVELIEDALEIPLRWRKPRRIFVNSMSDTFHESVPD
jgi:protein gp37